MSNHTPKTPKITFKYGKLDGDWDFIAANGPGTSSADRNLLFYVFTCCRYRQDWHKGGEWVQEPSIIEELEKRGYDTKTIKFSVEKKKP